MTYPVPDKIEITLNEDALLNSNYKDELESSNLLNNTYGPHYKLEVSSIESFESRYDELISSLGKQNSYEIEYLTESRTDIYSFLQTWGFTILILIGFRFILTRMSGGARPGRQIFNNSKSKASNFDKESKIKTNKENFCFAPLCKRAERITIPKSSRLVDIL